MYYGMSSGALQKLYVQGSLKNEENGFVFEIKNLIDSGMVSGITKLNVDGKDVPVGGVTVELAGKVRESNASLYVSYGAILKIRVPGQLEAGEHTIQLTVNAPELGQLTLPVTATI
ncbi:MAG: hypothetical protein JXC32_08390 [Anaerolineae bacterium]|nr:hypothetical protein [Anaerolineae bacterium]